MEKGAHVPAPTFGKIALFFFGAEGGLEGVEVGHPFGGEGGVVDVGFVEDEDHGHFGFVEDAAGVEHVAHEGAGGAGAGRVDDIGDDGGEGGCEGVEQDGTRGAPDEDFDLAGGVDDDVFDGFDVGLLRVGFRSLFQEVHDLIDLGDEEIEGGEDAAVWTEVVLLHDFFVVDGIADVDVAFKGDVADGGVEVHYVGRRLLGVEVGIDSLHESCLPRA